MKFSDFFNNPDPIIQQMATKLDEYSQQLKDGIISQAEYDDLVNDATSLNDVVRNGKTINELVLLDQAIEILKEIATSIPIP